MSINLNNGTLEFDINKLSAETNRELERYVNKCIAEMDGQNPSSVPSMPSNDTTNQGSSQGVKGSQIYGRTLQKPDNL